MPCGEREERGVDDKNKTMKRAAAAKAHAWKERGQEKGEQRHTTIVRPSYISTTTVSAKRKKCAVGFVRFAARFPIFIPASPNQMTDTYYQRET